jgi:hypothetical protein
VPQADLGAPTPPIHRRGGPRGGLRVADVGGHRGVQARLVVFDADQIVAPFATISWAKAVGVGRAAAVPTRPRKGNGGSRSLHGERT